MDDQIAVEDGEYGTPEPQQAVRLSGGRAVERLVQQQHRAGVVKQNAPLDVAHDDAVGKLGHERGKAVPFLLDALVRLAHPRVDVMLERLAQLRPRPFTLSASRLISAEPRGGARCAGFAATMICTSSPSLAGRRHVAADKRPHDEPERKQHEQGGHDQAVELLPHDRARSTHARARSGPSPRAVPQCQPRRRQIPTTRPARVQVVLSRSSPTRPAAAAPSRSTPSWRKAS